MATSPLIRLLLAAALAAGLGGVLTACGNGVDAAGGRPQAGPPAVNGGGRPAIPAMPVAAAPAEHGSIATYYTATASLDPRAQADILARVAGVVEAIVAEEGDRVAAGQVLLHIEDEEYRTRRTLAEVDLEQQELRFTRAEKLLAQGLNSSEEFDAARRDLRAAKAQLELAELELSYTEVRAPFSGRVVRRLVDPGVTVANGTPLFTLADMSRLLARVYVPAKEFRSIRTDQPVELVVTSSGDRLSGRIELINPMVDPSSGTIKVTVAVSGFPPTTRPGDFVEVSIVTDHHSEALLVPKVAVVSERGRRSVFVVADDAASQRTVEVGFEDDEHAEILAGVEPGELVVVQGQRALRDGQPVKLLDAVDLGSEPSAADAG